MRYVMLTYNGEETLRWWEAASQAEKQAEVERTVAWFQEHGAKGRIVGGEELGYPKDAKTVRARGVSDGPFIETKELLGRVHRARGAGRGDGARDRGRLAGRRSAPIARWSYGPWATRGRGRHALTSGHGTSRTRELSSAWSDAGMDAACLDPAIRRTAPAAGCVPASAAPGGRRGGRGGCRARSTDEPRPACWSISAIWWARTRADDPRSGGGGVRGGRHYRFCGRSWWRSMRSSRDVARSPRAPPRALCERSASHRGSCRPPSRRRASGR